MHKAVVPVLTLITLLIPFNVTPLSVLIYKLRLFPVEASVAFVATYPVLKPVDWKLPFTTWFNRIELKTSVGTSSRLANPFAAKKSPKAAFVGANTVNGPFPSNTDTRSAL